MSEKIIIAIDGPSGCGKSSTAREVAKRLSYIYIDTGAMYRATTFYFLENNIDLSDVVEVQNSLPAVNITFQLNDRSNGAETYLNNRNVEKEIRSLKVSEMVSEVSAISSVRKKMVELQREMGKGKGLVMDGRDIGTVVFPNAELKIYMTADIQIRAERRLKELNEKSISGNFEEVLQNLQKRDEIDTNRSDSPLKKAEDAILLDTSHLNFDEQVEFIVNLAINKISEN